MYTYTCLFVLQRKIATKNFPFILGKKYLFQIILYCTITFIFKNINNYINIPHFDYNDLTNSFFKLLENLYTS